MKNDRKLNFCAWREEFEGTSTRTLWEDARYMDFLFYRRDPTDPINGWVYQDLRRAFDT